MPGVLFVGDDPQLRIGGGQDLEMLRRRIGGAVVDDEDLPIVFEARGDGVDEPVDGVFLVVGGGEDGDLHFGSTTNSRTSTPDAVPQPHPVSMPGSATTETLNV